MIGDRRSFIKAIAISVPVALPGCSLLSGGEVDLVVYNHTESDVTVDVRVERDSEVLFTQSIPMAAVEDRSVSSRTEPMLTGVQNGETFRVYAEAGRRSAQSSVAVSCVKQPDQTDTVGVDIEPDDLFISTSEC